MSANPIRVTIAQSRDRPIARAALCRLLETQSVFTVAGEAADKEAVLRMVTREQPDILLLDAEESDDAVELLRALLQTVHESRVVVLTSEATSALQSRLIAEGALGIVRHDQTPEILFKAIQSVYGGEIWLERALAATALQSKTRAARGNANDPQSRIASLSEKEHEVISLVCQGLKNQAVAERLFLSEATVRHRLTAIFEKLRLSDRLELVIFAYRYGLAAPPR